MAITFTCSCGEKLQVPDGSAGRKAFCLRCRRSVPVPGDSASRPAEPLTPASPARGEGEQRQSLGTETPLLSRAVPAAAAEAQAPLSSTNDGNRATTADGGHGEATASRKEAESGQCVLVRDPDGKQFWKLTCACGKHIRTPAAVDQPYGKCPKCGQMLKMPGYLLSKGPVLVSARPGEGPVAAPSQRNKLVADALLAGGEGAAKSEAPAEKSTSKKKDDETETVTTPAVVVSERISRESSLRTADLLRPHHTAAAGESEDVGDRISAWPLAGKATRTLAAFIDVTFATLLAGTVMILASKHLLPAIFRRWEMVFILLVLAGVLNDGILHALWGGSIGKRLVVIVVKTAGGRQLGVARTILRALLKWLLIPGWVIGLVDPNERTLHDLLCNTLVLKGRAKHRHTRDDR